MKNLIEVKARIKELKSIVTVATKNIRSIERQKKSSTYKNLSNYSKSLLDEELSNEWGKIIDAIAEQVDLGVK